MLSRVILPHGDVGEETEKLVTVIMDLTMRPSDVGVGGDVTAKTLVLLIAVTHLTYAQKNRVVSVAARGSNHSYVRSSGVDAGA